MKVRLDFMIIITGCVLPTLLGCFGFGFTLTNTSYPSIILFNFAESENMKKSHIAGEIKGCDLFL